MYRRVGVVIAALVVAWGTAIAAAEAGTGASSAPAPSRHVQIARMRALAALKSRHVGLAPGIAPLTRKTTTDAVGDAGDVHADIVRITVSYNSKQLKLALHTKQPTNPETDPVWTSDNGIAAAEWAIDTNGDGQPEFLADFAAGASGRPIAFLGHIEGDNIVDVACPSASASLVKGAYVITMSPSCILDAPTIWAASFMIYVPDANGNSGGFDIAPDDSFLGPVTGPPGGYMEAASDGGVFSYGSARFHGSLGALNIQHPVVGVSATPGIGGYVMLGSDGGVFAFGDAKFAGSAAGFLARFVGIAMTPSGQGYWIATSAGAVLAFGDANFHGSTAGFALDSDVVAIAPTPSGGGYYLVTGKGAVLTFGDARFHGAPASLPLKSPIVAIAPTQSGHGYYVVAADGGVFTYGDAVFHGSAGNLRLRAPIVGIAASPSGSGYRLIARDGGVFTYGGVRYFGAASTHPLAAPIIGAAAL
jgi:hypothetical protein